MVAKVLVDYINPYPGTPIARHHVVPAGQSCDKFAALLRRSGLAGNQRRSVFRPPSSV